jgi:hypothetical protein
VTDAELRNLLQDCLHVWSMKGEVIATEHCLSVRTAAMTCEIRRGSPPARWFLQTPTRTRPAPSITALLSALRRALGGDPRAALRIGAQGPVG